MSKPSILLREAADDLLNLRLPPGAKFDMNDYGSHSPGSKPSFDNLCGTSACAAGWLSTLPKWRARGFKSEWIKPSFRDNWELKAVGYSCFDEMGADVFQTDFHDIYKIFQSVDASHFEVVEMFDDLAEKYEAMDL